MANFLRLVLGVLLLPACWGLTRTLADAILAANGGEGGVSAETVALLGGIAAFGLCWAALSHPVRAYVLGHELTHVKNRDILISTIAAAMAGVISWIANIAQWAAIFGVGRSDDDEEGGGLLGSLVTIIIAPIAAFLIQMAISRSREYAADKGGGEVCGNPEYLASALAKIDYYAKHAQPLPDATPATAHMFIVNPLEGVGSTIMNLFSTHPATEDRIARLHAQAQARR